MAHEGWVFQELVDRIFFYLVSHNSPQHDFSPFRSRAGTNHCPLSKDAFLRLLEKSPPSADYLLTLASSLTENKLPCKVGATAFPEESIHLIAYPAPFLLPFEDFLLCFRGSSPFRIFSASPFLYTIPFP